MFMECHPEPEKAHSDAATALQLDGVPALLGTLAAIVQASQSAPAR
jgi:3-deoxy-D-manno-octulosonic acid (KDO) 8-phosphate synthase